MSTILGEASQDVIASFMQRVILQYQNYGNSFRRSEPRELVAVPVTVQALSASYQREGTRAHCVTRDISCSGIGLFHTTPITSPYLELDLKAPESGEQMRVLATVEHCTPCGDFYLVGCRFAESPESTRR